LSELGVDFDHFVELTIEFLMDFFQLVKDPLIGLVLTLSIDKVSLDLRGDLQLQMILVMEVFLNWLLIGYIVELSLGELVVEENVFGQKFV
jgi:hypothetical protein